jgi:hypothetical protein
MESCYWLERKSSRWKTKFSPISGPAEGWLYVAAGFVLLDDRKPADAFTRSLEVQQPRTERLAMHVADRDRLFGLRC